MVRVGISIKVRNGVRAMVRASACVCAGIRHDRRFVDGYMHINIYTYINIMG